MKSDKEKSLRDEVNDLPGTLQPMGAVDPMSRPLWEIDKDFLNPYQSLPEVLTWAKIGERPALPKTGIVTFSAKQKKGKSLSTYAFALPLLSGRKFDTVTPLETPNMIIVFDMEMSETTLTQRALSQVKAIGENGQRFLICPLKGLPFDKMADRIEEKINLYNPPIVVIDQAGKMILDTNDTKTSNALTNLLDNWSKDRAVWVVMHENKSEADTNMRGHFGSYLSFAAVEAYTVDKKNGVFTVTYKEGRDTEADGAAQVNFILHPETNAITDATAAMVQHKESEAEQWRNDFRLIFREDETLTHSELVTRIMEQQGLEQRAARNKIEAAKAAGAIEKTGSDRRAPYRLTSPNSAAADFAGLMEDYEDDL